MLGIVYLASPFSHANPIVREERFRRVCRHAAAMMKAGRVVFSPIVHNHPVAKEHDLPRGWGFWSRMDEPFLRVADEVVVLQLPGWEISKGVQAEIALAKRLGIPVSYEDESP